MAMSLYLRAVGVVHIALEGHRGANETPVYRPLRAAWPVYNEVWWNSYDFAIRLAYLLVCPDDRDKLRNIRQRIEIIRVIEVRTAEKTIRKRWFFAGFIVGSILLPGTPAGLAAGASAASWALGSRRNGFNLQNQFSEALEKQVPALRGFANDAPNAAKELWIGRRKDSCLLLSWDQP